MEYPPLVAGHTALFAVHLTQAGRLQAGDAGQAAGRVHAGSRAGSRRCSQGRHRLGRVRSAWKAPPSRRALSLGAARSRRRDSSDRHDLGTITVFADEAAARADAEQQPPTMRPRSRI